MNQLKDYTDKQLQTAIHLLEQYHSASDDEVLHQLRVSLKKVKAVLDYLRTIHPKKIKPLRKKLQLVFHAAGSIREAQLHLQWLKGKRFHFLIQYASLEQKIKEAQDLFVTQKPGHLNMLTHIADELGVYLNEVNEEEVLHYALKLKQKFEIQIINLVKEDWHALRKLSKQLLYAHHWLNEEGKLNVLTVAEYKKLDILQEKIGVWHDVVELLQWLTDSKFFLSHDEAVKQQFNKAFALLQKDVDVKGNSVTKQLQAMNTK